MRIRHACELAMVTEMAVLEHLTIILRRVFWDDDLIATLELTAADVPAWDSLGHVRLLAEVEREFNVRFDATEIGSLRDVGHLAEIIGEKLTRVSSGSPRENR